EEIAVTESVMEMVVVVVAPLTIPPLDVSARDWPCGHRASCHWRTGHWAGSIKSAGGRKPRAHRALAWSCGWATRHAHRAATSADTSAAAHPAVTAAATPTPTAALSGHGS